MKKTILTLSVVLASLGVSAADAKPKQKAAESNVIIDIEQVKKDYAIPKSNEEVITDEVVKKRNEVFNNATIQEGQPLPELKTEVNFEKMKPMKGNVLPDIDKLQKFHQIEDIRKTDININAMLEHYQKLQQSGGTSKVQDANFEGGRAYLFVSSSMPKETLRNLMNDASRLGVSVLFNGNIDDKDPLKFGKMREYLMSLKLKSYVDMKIHPPAFTKFKITQVPAIVVASEDVDSRLDENGCANPKDFDIIRGDVKLDWALEKIYTESKAEGIKSVASQYMKKINASKGLSN